MAPAEQKIVQYLDDDARADKVRAYERSHEDRAGVIKATRRSS